MKRLLLLLGLVTVTATATACSATTPYAAKVNGTVIEASTVEDEIHAITSNPQYAEALDQQLQQFGGLRPAGEDTVNSRYVSSVIVYNRVLNELISQEIDKRGLTVTDEQRAQTEQTIRTTFGDDSLFDSLAANYRDYIIGSQARLETVLASLTTPEQERAYYDERAGEFDRVCFRRMVAPDQAQITAARDRVVNGADFGVVAAEVNGAAGVAAGGQDPAQEVCALESDLNDFARTVLQDLSVNGLSDALQDQAGFTVVQVTRREQVAFEEAQPGIRTTLSDRQAFFARALAEADVEVSPRFGIYQPAVGDQAGSIQPAQGFVLEPKASADSEAPLSGGVPLDGSTAG